jgi:hypothetical protein
MFLFNTWIAAIHRLFIQLGPILLQMKADIVSYVHMCLYQRKNQNACNLLQCNSIAMDSYSLKAGLTLASCGAHTPETSKKHAQYGVSGPPLAKCLACCSRTRIRSSGVIHRQSCMLRTSLCLMRMSVAQLIFQKVLPLWALCLLLCHLI